MNTFREIIDALGGYACLAEILSIPPGSASSMRSRDSVPAMHWKALVTAAEARGLSDVTYEALATIAAKEKDAPTDSRAA